MESVLFIYVFFWVLVWPCQLFVRLWYRVSDVLDLSLVSKRFGFWPHITDVIVLTFKEIKHLSDYRTVGLSDRRTIGLSDCRIIGRTPETQYPNQCWWKYICITKARLSAYSLFGCGFHGHKGLDPESLLHIYKTYITTSITLRYGAIITVLKTSWTTRTLPENDTKTNPVITDELSGPSRLYTNWNSNNRSTNSYKSPHILQ